MERRLDDKRPRKWRLKWGCVMSLEDETKTGVTGWRRWRSRGRDTQDMARRSMPRRSPLRSRLAMRRTACYMGASNLIPVPLPRPWGSCSYEMGKVEHGGRRDVDGGGRTGDPGWRERRWADWRRPYLSTNHHTRTLATSSTNSTMAVTRAMLSSSFVSLCLAVSFRYAASSS